MSLEATLSANVLRTITCCIQVFTSPNLIWPLSYKQLVGRMAGPWIDPPSTRRWHTGRQQKKFLSEHIKVSKT